MPLYILGLTLLIGLLIFQLVKLTKLNRYDRSSNRKKHSAEPENEQEKTLYFPVDNVEAEKHKRNIH